MSALRQLRRMDCCAFVEAKDAEGLQAFRTPHNLAVDPGAFISGLMTTGAQTCDVDQDISHAIVRHDEAVAFRSVEPFNGSSDFENFKTFTAAEAAKFAQ